MFKITASEKQFILKRRKATSSLVTLNPALKYAHDASMLFKNTKNYKKLLTDFEKEFNVYLSPTNLSMYNNWLEAQKSKENLIEFLDYYCKFLPVKNLRKWLEKHKAIS